MTFTTSYADEISINCSKNGITLRGKYKLDLSYEKVS